MEQRASLPGLVSQLTRDGTAVVRAEVALAKAKFSANVAAKRTGVILLVAAAIVGLLGLGALVIGLMLALATVIGFVAAALVTFLVLITIAAALGWLGSRGLSGSPDASLEQSA